MTTRIQKWGDRLALYIPQVFADDMRIGPDTPVEITVSDGNLVIHPLSSSKRTLDDLLAGITPDNQHDESDTGTAIGREAW